MAKEQFSKKDLEAVATDLNKIFEQPIPTGRKATITSLKKDLVEAAQEIQTDDAISDESKKILTALGAKLPFEKKEEAEKENEKEKSPEPKKEKKVSATGQILAMVCKNFKISNEEIRAGLDKMELQCSDSTISMQANDTRKAIACLQKLGKLS
jgi:hypothetical protein